MPHIASLYFNLDPSRPSGSAHIAVGHGIAARHGGYRFTLIANEAKYPLDPRAADEYIAIRAKEFATCAAGFADTAALEALIQRYVDELEVIHHRHPIDLVFAHHASYSLAICERFSARARIRLVAFVHGTELHDVPLEPRLRELIRLARNADTVVVYDEAQRQRLCEAVGVVLDNVTAIPPVADLDLFLNEAGPAECLQGNPALLAVSRLVPEKGIRELRDLIRLVRVQLPGVVLHVVGDGPERSVLEGDDGIVLHGPVDRRRLPAYLRSADAMVLLPRWQEPFGLTLIEAMVAGTPVVLRADGRLRENFDLAAELAAPESPGIAVASSTPLETVAEHIVSGAWHSTRLSVCSRQRISDRFGPSEQWKHLERDWIDRPRVLLRGERRKEREE